MQIRLAEVLAMLEEDDLSPEQRAKVRAKLQEVMERLAKEQATAPEATPSTGPFAMRWRAIDGDSPPRVRAEVVDVVGEHGGVFRVAPAEGEKIEVYEVTGEPAPDAVAPRAPRPPRPPKAPRAAKAPDAPRAMVFKAEAAEEGEHAHAKVLYLEGHEAHEAHKAHAQAEKRRAEDVQERVRVVRTRSADADQHRKILIELDRARAKASDEAEQEADVQFFDLRDARAGSDAKRKAERQAMPSRVRTRKIDVDADTDDADVRAMIDEMRAEMREIRDLMQELRRKSEEVGQGHNRLAPGSAFGSGNAVGGMAGSGIGPASAFGVSTTKTPR